MKVGSDFRGAIDWRASWLSLLAAVSVGAGCGSGHGMAPDGGPVLTGSGGAEPVGDGGAATGAGGATCHPDAGAAGSGGGAGGAAGTTGVGGAGGGPAPDCRPNPTDMTWSASPKTDATLPQWVLDLWAGPQDAVFAVVLNYDAIGQSHNEIWRRDTSVAAGWVIEDLPASNRSQVRALWGTSAGDLWAISSQQAFHRDASGTWTEVPVPNPENHFFFGINGTASNHVWIVGELGLVKTWDGTAWGSLPRAEVASGRSATLLDAWGTDNYHLWVGGYQDGSNPNIVLLRFDGDTWVDPFAGNHPIGEVRGLWGSSNDNVWAVGAFPTGPIMRYDGAAWLIVPLVAPGLRTTLNAIWGFCANDIWTVGTNDMGSGADGLLPEVAHWDGTSWTTLTAPMDGGPDNPVRVLTAVAGVGGAIWTGAMGSPILPPVPRIFVRAR